MDIENVLAAVDKETDHFFEERLRRELAKQDKNWLEEQLVSYILKEKDATFHEISATKKKHTHETLAQRKERIKRIRDLQLDIEKLKNYAEEFDTLTREYLEEEGYILSASHKGLEIISHNHRSAKGNELLVLAKDILFAILFCNEAQGVTIQRHQRDDLTITLASQKAWCLENFMLAVTEFPVKGVWYDPEGVSDDEDATNTIMQVEFSDDSKRECSKALMATLKLINNLEINEEILYCRIEEAQFSSLV